MTTEPPPPGPHLAAELAKLSPRQRELVESVVDEWLAKSASERLSRAALLDDLALRPSRRARLVHAWREISDPLSGFALFALIVVGGAGVLGSCIGIVLALVRAGWRLGASL